MHFFEIKNIVDIQYLLVWDNQNAWAMKSDQGEHIEVFNDWDSFQKRFEHLFCGEKEFNTSKFIFACQVGSKYQPIEYEVVTKIRMKSI